ncbi:MAG TPA: flavodoxin family protein [Methanoregula sp.]|nr:flavodoxin family protein [Methanoregula sp.]
MKVLGLSGSMRKDGNTSALVKVVLKRCADAGIPAEFVSLAGKKILPCTGCGVCREKKWCTQVEDDWDGIARQVIACDVFVIGSPTYYYDVCGQLKNFIDRTYSLYHDRQLAGRHAVAVAVHHRKGANRTIQTIEGFLNAHEFSSLGSVAGSGSEPGDVMNDPEAVKKARKIGDKIVRLLRPEHD